MRVTLLSTFMICGMSGSAVAQNGPFDAFSGHFYEQTLPAEILCPSSGFVLFPDGQLLERGIGANGVATNGGYLCSAGSDYATCAKGDISGGALVVPDTPADFQRLTLLTPDTIALGKLDGSGSPKLLARCPADFAPMLPTATPAAFLESPPPVVSSGNVTPESAAGSAWANVTLAPLPQVGVFAFFPRTDQSRGLIEMMANMPIDMIPDNQLPEGFDRDQLTPEVLTSLMETETCGKNPKVLTKDGLLLEVSVRRPNNAPAFAQIDALSSCTLAGGTMTCARTTQSAAGFAPDDSRGTFSFLHAPEPDGATYLCNPDLGRDHPDSCVQPVACPADYLSVPVKDMNLTLGDLPGWSPVQ